MVHLFRRPGRVVAIVMVLTFRCYDDPDPMSESPAIAAPEPIDMAAPVEANRPSPTLAPAIKAEYTRAGVDFRRPMPRPKVRGTVIDFHCHLLAARHAKDWFESADHYGIDAFVSMTPLEEAVVLAREWPGRIAFIAVPQWMDKLPTDQWVEDFERRIDTFYNLGSRMVKFHMAPSTQEKRGLTLDSPLLKPIFDRVIERKMAVMTHVGDPDTWYCSKYTDCGRYGTRDAHYDMWRRALDRYGEIPWVGAHMGGNPENLERLQSLLDTYPNLQLDCSATRWMVREISARRDEAREFFIRNSGRVIFGSDQVSGDDRHFDFLACRFWAHRKLWETAHIGPTPIYDPDLPEDKQPTLRGLALPDEVLQKLYHDNATKFLAKLGVTFEHHSLIGTDSTTTSA
ncbi:MAG: amidohydrolase family protein [Chthoniobacterales bacterium]|nr:amidohydrolase family protein [Chthoniobacterales bacterium]